VHLTLGILRTSQAVLYALSFSGWTASRSPPPAQVTPAVGPQHQEEFLNNLHYEINPLSYNSNVNERFFVGVRE
jgi:hypothetical protein